MGKQQRRIRVSGTKETQQPEQVRRLGRALVALARAQLEAEAQAEAEAAAHRNDADDKAEPVAGKPKPRDPRQSDGDAA